MQAIRIADQVSLIFSTVLSERQLGLVEEDEVAEVTDRAYWEALSKQGLELTDAVFSLVRELAPDLALKYNKSYIGLARNGQPNNFVYFRPKKDWVRVNIKLDRSDETQAKLEQAGLDLMDYDSRGGYYRFRLAKGDVQKHRDTVLDLIRGAGEDVHREGSRPLAWISTARY